MRDARRVGFVFPCYGGGLPGGVEESLRKIEVGLTAYKFGVCQYAGYMGSGPCKLDSIIPRYWTAVSHQCIVHLAAAAQRDAAAGDASPWRSAARTKRQNRLRRTSRLGGLA